MPTNLVQSGLTQSTSIDGLKPIRTPSVKVAIECHSYLCAGKIYIVFQSWLLGVGLILAITSGSLANL